MYVWTLHNFVQELQMVNKFCFLIFSGNGLILLAFLNLYLCDCTYFMHKYIPLFVLKLLMQNDHSFIYQLKVDTRVAKLMCVNLSLFVTAHVFIECELVGHVLTACIRESRLICVKPVSFLE